MALVLMSGGALVASLTTRTLSRVRAVAILPAAKPLAVEGKRADLPGFALQVGDVVSLEGREIWLESGWLLREAEAPRAAFLFCTDATVLVLPEPRPALFCLSEVAIELPIALPRTIELGGRSFELRERVPVELSALGTPPDPPWTSATLAEYRALEGRVVWLIERAGRNKAWLARRVQPSDIDVWGRV